MNFSEILSISIRSEIVETFHQVATLQREFAEKETQLKEELGQVLENERRKFLDEKETETQQFQQYIEDMREKHEKEMAELRERLKVGDFFLSLSLVFLSSFAFTKFRHFEFSGLLLPLSILFSPNKRQEFEPLAHVRRVGTGAHAH